MNVFLVGYMGVGKTTIGKRLSTRLGLEFIDLDTFIGAMENRIVPEIITQNGEEHFREIERRYLRIVSQKSNVLVSTGGGAPCFYDNMAQINKSGISIYLKMDEKSLAKRLIGAKQKRPLLKGKNETEMVHFITNHLKERKPFYEQAQISFEALKTNAGALEELVKMIKDNS